MNITESQVRRIMPKASSENISEFVKAFNAYSDQFGLTTKIRVCHFLGQIAWESSELSRLEENLNYSADGLLKTFPRYFKSRADAEAYARRPEKIANRVYANRMGNGSESTGDGWKYRGRGIIQLTGKQNYYNYNVSGYCNGNVVEHPEWLAKYPGALKSAMWFWKANGINALADRDDATSVTRRINGGSSHLAQREYYTRVAKRVFAL